MGCISPWVQLIFGRSGERPTEQSARLSDPQRGELHGLSGWPPRGWSPSGSPSPGFVMPKVCLLEKAVLLTDSKCYGIVSLPGILNVYPGTEGLLQVKAYSNHQLLKEIFQSINNTFKKKQKKKTFLLEGWLRLCVKQPEFYARSNTEECPLCLTDLLSDSGST